MIPERDRIETFYPADVVDELMAIREFCNGISDPEQRNILGREALSVIWPTQAERIQNTHWIQIKPSKERGIQQAAGIKLLRWNLTQQRFYNDVWLRAKQERRPCRVMVLKARQLGMSTQMQSIYSDEAIERPNIKIQTISYDKPSTHELFDKSRFIYDNLWFPRKLARDRAGQIAYAKPHNSAFYTTTARNALAGRGWFFACLHLSEVPMWDHPDETANSVLQCVADAPDTSVVMEFTARGAQGYAYEMWCDAVDGKNDFVPFFAPWFWDEGYTKPFESEARRREFAAAMTRADHEFQARYGLTFEQMHWWAWCLRNNCGGNEAKRRQEYPSNAEEAFLTSGSPVFERTDILQNLKDGCREPRRRGHVVLASSPTKVFEPQWIDADKGPQSIWDEPLQDRKYVIGVDVASGKFRDIGRQDRVNLYTKDRPDYTAAIVLEHETGNHVATWHGYAAPMEMATYLAALGILYNTALMAVELNGPGDALMDHLRGVLSYPNLFRSRFLTRTDAEGNPQPGWITNETTRHIVIGNLERAYKDGVLFTRDVRVIQEMWRMQHDKMGNPRAMNRDKDDLVFAFGIGLQAIYETTTNQPIKAEETPRHRDSWVWDQLKSLREAAVKYASRPFGTRHDRLPPRQPLPSRGRR